MLRSCYDAFINPLPQGKIQCLGVPFTLVMFFKNSPIGILYYHSVCVVNLPIGKPPKGLVVRSRYPQGNRALCETLCECDYGSSRSNATLGIRLCLRIMQVRDLNRGKLPRVL